MSLKSDPRTVMTLDAGGTTFVFSAMRGQRQVLAPIAQPSHGDDLDDCLQGIIDGFARVRAALDRCPDAISFAFPGPADYPAGIIGKLGNLPAFRDEVALGPMLEDHFDVPVYINNDGDLFAYGEAIAGLLPEVNEELARAGNPKRFRHLFGATLGTGFGGGIVRGGQLLLGDNSGAGEVWRLRHKLEPRQFVEEGVSIRAVRRSYAEMAGIPPERSPEPQEIFAIAEGRVPGNRTAAEEAFRRLGEIAGDALATVTTLIDGLIVIGGGLAGAAALFLPSLVAEMNGHLESLTGKRVDRMGVRAFNLEQPEELREFLSGAPRELEVPYSRRRVLYDPLRRVGVGLSRLGTSRAVAVGAYAFALDALDRDR